uniref:Uncharacterized protein n=1 Tax=Anguilla anguilla TaxID=7936 RepID=A0A0E9U7P3_ANGAN
MDKGSVTLRLPHMSGVGSALYLWL